MIVEMIFGLAFGAAQVDTDAAQEAPTPTSVAAAGEAIRPNIVWIFTEDMNDWMGCYGDNTVTTPNIDSIASGGVRFDRAYMPAGVCSATRSAIALGAMQTSLGVHNHRSSRQRVPEEVIHLPEGVSTVYEMMRAAGYFVSSQGAKKNDFNFMFDVESLYDVNVGKTMDPQWRKRTDDKPFFAQIQLWGGKSKVTLEERVDPATVEVMPYYPDHEIYRKEIAHHYDCVKQTDNEVGLVLDALREDGLLENTVVFFWTDHGMRLPRHKQWLYEGGIRVPLVVMGPGVNAQRAVGDVNKAVGDANNDEGDANKSPGLVRSDLVSGIDITVTTLSLAGIPIPAHMEGRNLFAADHQPREYVISARDRCDYTIDRVRAVTTKRYKYLRNFLTDRPFMQPQYRDGRPAIEIGRELFQQGKLNDAQAFIWNPVRVGEELYDLENDPHEIHNLATDPAHAEVLQKHRNILAQWMDETGDQGQQLESIDSLRGVLKRWNKKAVNPEFDRARNAD